jgi:serine/threonine protein phosphatase PrpC
MRPSNNEDYCLIEPERGLYVLADGMGGAKAGEKASRLAVDTVAEIVHAAPQLDSQVLLTAVEEANKRVLTAAQSDPELEGMGTTLVAALDLTEGFSIASVGDSRAYVLDDGGLRVITDDQTWVNEVGRPLGLDEESLRNHPMRHVLTMAIGASAPAHRELLLRAAAIGRDGAAVQRWTARRAGTGANRANPDARAGGGAGGKLQRIDRGGERRRRSR